MSNADSISDSSNINDEAGFERDDFPENNFFCSAEAAILDIQAE